MNNESKNLAEARSILHSLWGKYQVGEEYSSEIKDEFGKLQNIIYKLAAPAIAPLCDKESRDFRELHGYITILINEAQHLGWYEWVEKLAEFGQELHRAGSAETPQKEKLDIQPYTCIKHDIENCIECNE